MVRFFGKGNANDLTRTARHGMQKRVCVVLESLPPHRNTRVSKPCAWGMWWLSEIVPD